MTPTTWGVPASKRAVGGEDVEVAADVADVDRHPRHGLAAVEQQPGADLVGEAGGAARVEHRPEHVGNMGEGDQLVALGEQDLERIEVDPAVGGERADVDRGAGALGDELPGDDVGMMLEHRQHDAVAGSEMGARPALRDEVDAFGGAADEHDLLGACGADEVSGAAAARLEGERHLGRTLVDAAMDGRISLAIGAGDGVDDGLRLLCGGGAVEIGPAFGDGREVGEPVERASGGGDVHQPFPLRVNQASASA